MTNNLFQSKLLIGEGKDEVRFFVTLLKELNINNIQVEDYGGKTKLPSYLKTLKVRPGFSNLTSVRITRDADDLPPKSAFDSICYQLERLGFSVPQAVGEVVGDSPSVGIFIFPDCINCGMLEDLCLASVQDDLAMTCVENYFECVKIATQREPNNMAKAKVHAWLSSQIIPDKRLAEAAEAGYWNWNSPAFDRLKQFLVNL